MRRGRAKPIKLRQAQLGGLSATDRQRTKHEHSNASAEGKRVPTRGDLRIVARTDLGRVAATTRTVAFDEALGIAVLADGMGGLNAGEVASATAIDVVMQYVVEQSDRLHGGDAAETLRDALAAANRRVHALSKSRREYTGWAPRWLQRWSTTARSSPRTSAILGHTASAAAS